MTEKEKQFNQWFDWYADGVKVFEEADMKQAYLAGAEPREKRIAELKAEVKEWKDKADLWCKTANLKDHNIMINKELEKENADLKEEINKIAFARGNLEEENAELKETLKTYNGCGDWDNDFHTCRVYLRHEELQMYADQLTKAKEIIKELYEGLDKLYLSGLSDKQIAFIEQLQDKTEQFLSEVEK